MTANPTQSVNWTSFGGFEVGLSRAGGGTCGFGGASRLNITVVEPNFVTYRGGIEFSDIGLGLPKMWITPDLEAGVDFRSYPSVVMVEAGF